MLVEGSDTVLPALMLKLLLFNVRVGAGTLTTNELVVGLVILAIPPGVMVVAGALTTNEFVVGLVITTIPPAVNVVAGTLSVKPGPAPVCVSTPCEVIDVAAAAGMFRLNELPELVTDGPAAAVDVTTRLGVAELIV